MDPITPFLTGSAVIYLAWSITKSLQRRQFYRERKDSLNGLASEVEKLARTIKDEERGCDIRNNQ